MIVYKRVQIYSFITTETEVKVVSGGIAVIVLLFSACGQGKSALYDGSAERYRAATAAEAAAYTAPRMDLEQLVGQMLILQLRYTRTGGPKRSLEPEDRALLRQIGPGGVVFFGENMGNIPQVVTLGRDIQEAAQGSVAGRPFIAIDQEGGLVSRLHSSGGIPATRIPSARSIGRTGDYRVAEGAGEITGRELSSLGIQLNFAPVADLSAWQTDSFIGSRSYGGDPETTAGFVAAFIQGQRSQGVWSVIKHYPGHGDTTQDSHHQVVEFEADIGELMDGALVPFIRGIDAGAAGIMAAHIAYPRVDETGLPASVSPVLLGGLLRERLGFDGLIVTDALEMRGLSRVMSPEQAAVQAVLAGADCILTTEDPLPTRDAIVAAVRTGVISRDRIVQSVRRILGMKGEMGLLGGIGITLEEAVTKAEGIIGRPEHKMRLESLISGAGGI